MRNKIFKYIIVVILFLFGFRGFSQSQKTYYIPDSLKGKTYKELFKQHNFHYDKNDTIKAFFYAKMYLHKGKNENDTIRIANGYSQFLGTTENNHLSIVYADSIISLTKYLNHHYYPGYGYMAKGISYYGLYNFNKSLDNYLIAKKYVIKTNNEQLLYYIDNGIGEIKMFWGNYNEALLHFKSQLNYLTKNNNTNFDQYNYFVTLYNLSNGHIQLKQLDSALIYTKKGITKSLEEKDDYWYYSFVEQSGYIAYYNEDYVTAIDSINKGAIVNDTPNNFLNTHYYKGNIFNKLNKVDKAFYHFKKADSIYDTNPKDIVPEIRDIQEYFVKYYGEKKDFTNQLKYIDRLLRVDSIMDSYRKNLNETITREYDRPGLLAEKQSIINTLERKKTKSILLNGSLITLLILLSGFTIRFYYMQNVYKKRFKNIVNTSKTEKEETVIKPIESLQNISQDIVISILKQLEQFENNNTFLNKNITLNKLAKNYNTNSSYLSKVINYYKQKNFNTYLTSLRIEYCINALKTEKTLRSYTIKAIANEMGFKNSESFSKAFFKTTGIYPSFFIKQTEKYTKVT